MQAALRLSSTSHLTSPSSTPFHKPSPSSCNLPAHLCASRCHHCRTCTSGRSWPCPNTLGTASSRKLRPLPDSNERLTRTSNWQHVDLSKASRISQIALPDCCLSGRFPGTSNFALKVERSLYHQITISHLSRKAPSSFVKLSSANKSTGNPNYRVHACRVLGIIKRSRSQPPCLYPVRLSRTRRLPNQHPPTITQRIPTTRSPRRELGLRIQHRELMPI
jgi:hypothetical protein